jgi:hypothetical protein
MVTVTTNALPQTGFAQPTVSELHRLKSLVRAAYPELEKSAAGEADFDEQFCCAFYRIGYMFRLNRPSPKKYFWLIVEEASSWLLEKGMSAVSVPAFLAACHAHGDVPWQAADPSVGALLEVGLDPYDGRVCNNAWRDLLLGARRLRAPTPSRYSRNTTEPSRVRIYKEDESGQMQLQELGGRDR